MTEQHRIRLVHWNEAESRQHSARLSKAGYEVEALPIQPSIFNELRANPPDIVIIDLTRLPSHGRDVAVALRKSKATRHVPLVFVGGDETKVKRVQALLPDATYASWRGIRGAIHKALRSRQVDPVVPASAMAGYSKAPLCKKLGIKENCVVRISGAPAQFEQTLRPLPAGAAIKRTTRGVCDLMMWFPARLSDLEGKIERFAALTPAGGLWICWPKKTSGVKTDLTQAAVRSIGLANGLVDYKIAAIDATWSGLKFAKRKKKR